VLTLPSLLLGFVISILLGAVFHVWRGGGGGKLLLYLVLGFVGFWVGQFLAERFNISYASVGSLHLGLAVPCGLSFLFLGHWLSLVEPEKRPRKRIPKL
jgi:uncharacterized membrane protein YeaQ/YmgE (transglycosylase-associated protein family)